MARDRTLLTPKQAAAMLAVHPATLSRWVSEGKLRPVVLPSGRYRYRLEEIETILTGIVA